ncbi:VCBS domain-containing protein [Mycolicibacterium austroafricanum]|uniref:VCBS domain-containing protein n=1 Tax=Mycolicibacterium austroafricanum TaxID=39687 RepID=UPI001CA337F0|nr:VCBS domain-containing protein [Mycolicibacterium austroafricanum]QZT63710.1 VCBS domain-containing protein [Mycolicibacterium austroafricanum]
MAGTRHSVNRVKGRHRAGVRDPYRWLGAGAVALGLGAAVVGGAGVAYADDGDSETSSHSPGSTDSDSASADGTRPSGDSPAESGADADTAGTGEPSPADDQVEAEAPTADDQVEAEAPTADDEVEAERSPADDEVEAQAPTADDEQTERTDSDRQSRIATSAVTRPRTALSDETEPAIGEVEAGPDFTPPTGQPATGPVETIAPTTPAEPPAPEPTPTTTAQVALTPATPGPVDPGVPLQAWAPWTLWTAARRERGAVDEAVQTAIATNVPPANSIPTIKATAGSPSRSTGVVTGTVKASDKDRDPLTYTASTDGTRGAVVIDAKGKFTYTPTATARHAAAAVGAGAEAKTDTVTFTVSDGRGGTGTVAVVVKISPRNVAPTGAIASVGLPDSATGVVRGRVSAQDADDATLLYTAPANTRKGTIVVESDGRFTYTPTAAALAAARVAGARKTTKIDKFTVTVTDGHGGKTSTTVTVAIVNGAPVISGAPTVSASDGASGKVSGKATFTDPDRDKLTFGGTASTAHGNVVVNSNGTFTYTPTVNARLTAGASGNAVTDSFTLTAKDIHGATASVTVSVAVDPARHIVTGSIPVGASPSGVVLSRDGKRAYVANYGAGTLSVINTATNTVVGSPIKLGVQPGSIAISPNGSRLYIAGSDATTSAGKVTVVDTAKRKIVGSPVAIAGRPTAVAVSPDGTKVFVTSSDANTVTVIATATNTVVGAPIALGGVPTGIAVSPQGRRVYVTNGTTDSVSVIDIDTGTVVGAPIAVGSLPTAIVLTSDGTRAYIANTNARNVTVVNTATNRVVGAPIAVGVNPQAIAISPDNTLIYVVSADGAMSVISASSNTVVGSPLTVGVRPAGLSVSPDGTRVYTTSSDGRLTVVSLASTRNAPVAPTTQAPATTTSRGTVTGSLGVTDPTAVKYAVAVRPAFGTVTVKSDGSYTYTPTAAARQYATTAPVTDSFTVNATNARGASTAVTVTVSVAPASVTATDVIPKLMSPIVAYNTEFEIDRPYEILLHPNGSRAYTLNTVSLQYNLRDPDSISVIDTTTNTVVGQPIRINDAIGGAALSPNGLYLYVSRQYSGTVWALDTTGNTVVAEIKVGEEPTKVIASPDGKRIYVVNSGGGWPDKKSISVIDTASRKVVGGAMPLAAVPDVIISGDSNRLYLLAGGRVSMVNTATMTVAATVDVGVNGPAVLSRDGRKLYVLSSLSKEIVTVDTATATAVTRSYTSGWSLEDLAVSPDGKRLYVTSDKTLFVIDANTGAVVQKPAFDGQPLGVAASPDGKRVYVLTYVVGAEGVGTRVLTYDITTNRFVGSPLALSRLPLGQFANQPMVISADSSRVYVPAVGEGGTYVVDTGHSAQAPVTATAAELYARLRRLTDYPWNRDGLAIEKVRNTAGTTRVIVYFGGTVGQVPSGESAKRDVWRNLPLYFDNYVDGSIATKIERALADLPSNTEIMFVGYSQGGMDAQNLAAAWPSSNRKGVVTTVLTFAAPVVRPPGARADHVVHLRANFDPVPLLGIPGHPQVEAAALRANQIFAVNANVPPTLDLHGDPKTYVDVGLQFDNVAATRFPTIKADLARFTGTLVP